MRPKLMTWDQASRYIYNSDTLFVDLRDQEEYAKWHVTGSWNIPYDEWEEHLREMESYARVIFYCTHGNHSLAAARTLSKFGREAYSIAGGYERRRGASADKKITAELPPGTKKH